MATVAGMHVLVFLYRMKHASANYEKVKNSHKTQFFTSLKSAKGQGKWWSSLTVGQLWLQGRIRGEYTVDNLVINMANQSLDVINLTSY